MINCNKQAESIAVAHKTAISQLCLSKKKFFFFSYLSFNQQNIFFVKDIENNTWVHGDVEFLYKCSTQYLASDCSN